MNVWAILQTWVIPSSLSILTAVLTTLIVLRLTSRKEKKQAVWTALKDDLLTVKKNAGSVYNSLWQHYAITQVEEDVRSKLTAITETSGALQEHRKIALAITDFVHFANIVIERKKGHEFTSREDKDENDRELTRRFDHLVKTCNRLIH